MTNLSIDIKKLFLLTIILKTISSLIGWLIGSNWANWIFGLTLPLFFMAAYVSIGVHRKAGELTDEKFADTCYYLGFIFTIVSIVFCLLDIPNIGTALAQIAVRFGAAMVSTVIGLVVRVYLINFKKEFTDAIIDSEDALLNATQKYILQLESATNKADQFQTTLIHNVDMVTERVNSFLETNLLESVKKLESAVHDTSQKLHTSLIQSAIEISAITKGFSENTNAQLNSTTLLINDLERQLTTFLVSFTERLQPPKLPSNFFTAQLQPALDDLALSTSAVSAQSNILANDLKKSTGQLHEHLEKINKLLAAQEQLTQKNKALSKKSWWSSK